jgi:ATP-dependent helicase/nuclease subunit B
MEPMDVGTVHHAILEEFLKSLQRGGDLFTELPDAEVLPRRDRCAERIGAEWGREGEPSTARDAYIRARGARDLAPVIHGQRQVVASGRFRPRAAELKFGFQNDPESLAALEIDTPKGRRVLLRGLVDRVDLAEAGDELLGIVLDYKRTLQKRLKLAEVYHGLSLQLLGYLLVLAERGETLAGRPIVPAGAFYVSLMQKYRSVDHPEAAPTEADSTGAKPRGLLDSDRLSLLDEGYGGEGKSQWFNIFRKKDGGLGNVDRSDAAEPADFKALLDYTRGKMGELADSVLDGRVSVAPYRLGDFSPCQWCAMRPVCRFEFQGGELRFLDPIQRSEVFRRIRSEG